MTDMHITVGHIINNPTFPFDGDVEITKTDDDGTVHTLFDSMTNNCDSLSADLLTRTVTYMVVNSEFGRLRVEIG